MTIREMALKLDVPYCWGMLKTGHYCTENHIIGSVDLDGTVHLFDRQPLTKTTTQRFLKLAARAYDPTIDEDMPWRRVYRMDRLARSLGRKAGVRLPSRYWKHDKAFVLAGVAGLSNDMPDRKQAYDWARR